jgi:hypothetical protein
MSRKPDSPAAPEELPASVRAAFVYLKEAHEAARHCGRSPWDFAVELRELQTKLGLSSIDLRWLVSMGYVTHAVEATKAGQKKRVFGKPGGLVFGDTSCFVLTAAGVSVASGIHIGLPEASGQSEQPTQLLDGGDSAEPRTPAWDHELRQLRARGKIAIWFRRPAPNQETVLAAFEEDGWPPHIYNPLSPRDQDDDVQQRLHDTAIRLNRHRANDVVLFRLDGTGQGLLWEYRRNEATIRIRWSPDPHPIDN